jgi:hypothetical protein
MKTGVNLCSIYLIKTTAVDLKRERLSNALRRPNKSESIVFTLVIVLSFAPEKRMEANLPERLKRVELELAEKVREREERE